MVCCCEMVITFYYKDCKKAIHGLVQETASLTWPSDHLVPVLKMDSTIHWVNHYPVNDIYRVDSTIHLLNNWCLVMNLFTSQSIEDENRENLLPFSRSLAHALSRLPAITTTVVVPSPASISWALESSTSWIHQITLTTIQFENTVTY